MQFSPPRVDAAASNGQRGSGGAGYVNRGSAWRNRGEERTADAFAGNRGSRFPAGQEQRGSPYKSGRAAGGFPGACFTCPKEGHQASECPQMRCFACGGRGHAAGGCAERERGARTSCQVCDAPNVTFKNCKNCVVLREKLGNGLGRRDIELCSPANQWRLKE